jgi:hypothetical protein
MAAPSAGLTGLIICSTFVLMEVETLGVARSLGWKVHMRCAAWDAELFDPIAHKKRGRPKAAPPFVATCCKRPKQRGLCAVA